MLLLLVLLFFTAPTFTEAKINTTQLYQPLQTHEGPLTDQDWRAVLEVYQDDAEASEQLQQVMRKMGYSDLSQIRQIIRVCPDLKKETLAGYYHRDFPSRYVRRKNPFNHGPSMEQQLEDQIRGAAAVKKSYRGPFEELLVVKHVYICLNPMNNMGDTVFVMIHELQHLIGTPLFERPSMLQFADSNDHAVRTLFDVGGEFEAFLTEAQFYYRLKKKSEFRSADSDALLRRFDENGQLKEPQAFAGDLLEGRRYKKQFIAQYTRALQTEITQNELEIMNLKKNRISLAIFAYSGVTFESLFSSEEAESMEYAKDYIRSFDLEVNRLEAEVNALKWKQHLTTS